MNLPPKQCLCCGREIVKDQFCAETPDQFAKRNNGSWCRAKCKRNLPSPSPKDRPALVADPTAWHVGAVETVPVEKEKPVRDAARLAFARSMPCALCGCIQGVHAHHEAPPGQGTLSGKTSDRNTLGLCPKCHMLRHDKGREVYGSMDVERVIAAINEAYDERRKG